MPSLKTLKARLHIAEIKYLNALVSTQKSELILKKAANDALMNERNELRRSVEMFEVLYKNQQEETLRLLMLSSTDVFIPHEETRQAFYAACADGRHIEAVKLLKNSNMKIAMGLKMAKDLYEKVYRRWDLYPQGEPKERQVISPPTPTPPPVKEPGVFKKGDKVICTSSLAAVTLQTGKEYEVSEVYNNNESISLVGLVDCVYLATRFKHATE